MEINENTARMLQMFDKLTPEQQDFAVWLLDNMAHMEEYQKRTGEKATGPYAKLIERLDADHSEALRDEVLQRLKARTSAQTGL